MIELQKISKQYRGISANKDSGVYLWIKNFTSLTSNKATPLLALNNISFSVASGEVFGIYGENGAGKTTLIKILSGLLCPTKGEVKIDGHCDIRHIKKTISYISTNGWMGLEWQLSAKENLILYGNLFGLSGKKLYCKCSEVLEAIGMTEAKDKYISQLSAGMRQKITIARGLIIDRPIIFYDEPSVSLDVQSARNLRALIKADAIQNKRTAIIASHNVQDLSICDRLMFLYKGAIIAIGTMEELKKPFSGIEIIEVSFLKQNQALSLDNLQGIERAAYSSGEGERDVQNVKLFVRKNEFFLNHLVEYFIEKGITVQSIKPMDFTLQTLYEYYLEQKGGFNNVTQ
jgi:ABC-2 type transport system ATP-binding protein